MKLFEEKQRNNFEPSKYNENTYNYLDSSNREKAIEIRMKLERMFERYPKNEQKEVKNRLMDNRHFESTFFEMYLYNLFIEKGFQMVSHPTLEDTNNRPDFLLKKEGIEVYLEAKVDYNLSQNGQSMERKLNQVIDSINSIDGKQFRIAIIDLNIISDKQPSIRKFREDIKFKLKNLDKVTSLFDENDTKKLLTNYYEDDNLEIEYDLFIVPKTYNDSRLIMVNSPTVQWVNSHLSLRKALEKKASRYGNMNKPFILAINALDFFVDEEEVRNAVLGDLGILLGRDYNGNFKDNMKYHKNNGFFSYEDTEKNNNISGVIIYQLYLGNIDNPKYWFILNPNAKYKLNKSLFDFKFIELLNGKFIETN